MVAGGGFPNIDRPTLAHVLRSMGAADLIEQTPEGLLITGLIGERIISHHDFYVAFIVDEEYRVNHDGHHVGNVAFVPELEEEHFLILAGRRWQILDIDHDRKVIAVKPSPGGRAPDFRSSQRFEIHPRVRAAMKSLLETAALPQFLDMKAREMLLQARATAAHSGLLRNPFIQDGPDTIWFTWTGTKIQRTLLGLGVHFGRLKVSDERVALVFEKAPVAQVKEIYCGFLTECPDAVSLAMQFPHRIVEKYDRYLSDDLTALVFARERLDLNGALDKIREISLQSTSAK